MVLSLFLDSVSAYASDMCRAVFVGGPELSLKHEGLSDSKKLLIITRALGRELTSFEISVLLDVIHLPLEPMVAGSAFDKNDDHRYQIKYFLAQAILSEPIFDRLFVDGVLSSKWHSPSPAELNQIQEMKSRLGLSDLDVKLLNQYSADLYYDVNRFEISDSSRAQVLAALAKLPKFAGTVYRGISFRRAQGFSVGAVVEAEAIWSTSKNRETADEWVEDGVTLVIQTTAGRVLGPLARYPSESEVIVLPGSRFRVLRVDRSTIYLSEVN